MPKIFAATLATMNAPQQRESASKAHEGLFTGPARFQSRSTRAKLTPPALH